jgi:hypothetical protein
MDAWARHRRWTLLRQWARANDWTLVARPVVDWGARLPGGDKHGVTLALTGEIGGEHGVTPVLAGATGDQRAVPPALAGGVGGRRTSVGEYSFEESAHTPAGTTTTTHEFVVPVLHLDRPSGYLGVLPCDVLERWGQSLFGAGAPIGVDDFDAAYRVVGDPVRGAYEIGPELVAAHVAGVAPPWTLYGTELVTWRPGRIDPAHLGEQVGPLHLVARLLTGDDSAG